MERHTQSWKYQVTLLLLCLLIGGVQADESNPPGSVEFCGYVSHCSEIGVWWINATDADFNGVQIWFDNVYQTTTASSSHFYNPRSEIAGEHVISTHTIDSYGNINATWVNITVSLGECPECKEAWFCGDDSCADPTGTATPTPTPTPTTTVTPTTTLTYNPLTDNCQVRADAGETWIQWDVLCNTTVGVYYNIDGEVVKNPPPHSASEPDRLIISNLNSLETHNLRVYYMGEVIAESEVTTLASWYMILFFVVLSLVLSTIGMLFVSSPAFRILLGGLGLVLAVWTMTLMTGVMLAVPIIPAIFAGIVIILALKDMVAEAWGN